MKEIDYPAGHSMDTDWFAVDKNGDIGFFDTGQEGAYPFQVDKEISWAELFWKHTIPITKGLKQLFLDESTLKQLLARCTTDALEKMTSDDYWGDGYILWLNDGKTWEDLYLEEYFAESKEDFALLLSPNVSVFLIDNAYYVQDKIVNAIKNGVVYKACAFTMYPEEGDAERVTVSELGAFVYENENFDRDPYERLCGSGIPLNISLFSGDRSRGIPKFAEIAFSEQKFIQPMAHFSCRSYVYVRPIEDTPQNLVEEGYVRVKLSDEEWAYCLVSPTECRMAKTDLYQCRKCDKMRYDSSYRVHSKLFQDYPPVLLIQDSYHCSRESEDCRLCAWSLLIQNSYHCSRKEELRNDEVLGCLSECLQINKYDYYMSYCIKCYPSTKESLELRFQKCHGHFEVEIDTLQPLLLITLEESAKNLIHQYYQISNLAEAPCLCSVSIKGKTYPLLVVNDMKTAEDKEKLMRYLKSIAGEIKAILGKQRNLPAPKPRVIRIDESSQPVPDQ